MKLNEKDAPCEQTIEAVSDFFESLQLPLEINSARNPMSGCWSHTISCKSCRSLATNGKGAFEETSIASGFGEFVERFASGYLFADYGIEKNGFYYHPDEICLSRGKSKKTLRRQQYDSRLLTPELLQFYDPNGELSEENLMDNNYDDNDRGIIAIPFHLLENDKEIVYFPVSILNNLYVSNGMAAGNSRFECLSQALSEIFERYVKFRVISEGIALPDIPQSTMDHFPDILGIIEKLKENGYQLRVKDASLGGLFPVICVLLLCPDGGVFASFGCSCRMETALTRTFTEMLQGREMNLLKDFEAPALSMELFSSSENLENHFINSDGYLPLRIFREIPDEKFHLEPWVFHGTTADEFHHLLHLLQKTDYTAYIQEFDQFPLHVCRIIIPGMSEIYPPEDLLWNNCNRGSWLRQSLLKLPKMKEKKLLQFYKKLDQYEFSPETLVSYLIGVCFPETSIWNGLRIGELRAMTVLVLLPFHCENRDLDESLLEEARQWCQWCEEYIEDENRRRMYRILQIYLAIDAINEHQDEYRGILDFNYDIAELKTAEEILSGKIIFWGLEFAEKWQEISPEYGKILQAHQIRQKILMG